MNDTIYMYLGMY